MTPLVCPRAEARLCLKSRAPASRPSPREFSFRSGKRDSNPRPPALKEPLDERLSSYCLQRNAVSEALQSLHEPALHLAAVALIEVVATKVSVCLSSGHDVVSDDQDRVSDGEGGALEPQVRRRGRLTCRRQPLRPGVVPCFRQNVDGKAEEVPTPSRTLPVPRGSAVLGAS